MGTSFAEFTEELGELPRHWWVVALRGAAAIIFGTLAFIWPTLTLEVLILFFGAYAIADGILALYSAIRSHGQHTGALLAEGILGIAAGLIAFFWPSITALALVMLIAAWALLTGALEVYTAIRLRRVVDNEWALAASGALSLIFGMLLVAQPGAGAVALVWLIGLYAVLFGISMLVFAWHLRGLLQQKPEAVGTPHVRPI